MRTASTALAVVALLSSATLSSPFTVTLKPMSEFCLKLHPTPPLPYDRILSSPPADSATDYKYHQYQSPPSSPPPVTHLGGNFDVLQAPDLDVATASLLAADVSAAVVRLGTTPDVGTFKKQQTNKQHTHTHNPHALHCYYTQHCALP